MLAAILIVGSASSPLPAQAAETPAKTWTGYANALSVLDNIDYSDVSTSRTWAADAIWEVGALELMKGYGSQRFGLGSTLTVEQALAVAYNAVGREGEAQVAAETLDAARAQAQKLYPAPKMWSDGYLQLALNDGLITAQDFRDAVQTDQTRLTAASFQRTGGATREDMAVYLGTLLGLAPVYGQTKLFNAYSDWSLADPVKIPMIEAVLQAGIMNGDANGRFRPTSGLVREEAAQILLNAEPEIFALRGFEKHRGTVENVTVTRDATNGRTVDLRNVDIRNSDGTLHRITLTEPVDPFPDYRNELNGTQLAEYESTVVNRTGTLGTGTLLAAGQDVSWIADAQGRVRYARIASTAVKTAYHLGRVISTDPATRTLNFRIYQTLPGADIALADAAALAKVERDGDSSVWTVSANASIFSESVQKSFQSIVPDSHYIVTVENDMVTAMQEVSVDLLQQGGRVSGIVREASDALGYIVLYAADGTGVSSGLDDGFSSLRTYSWDAAPTVVRDGSAADIPDIIPGDSVWLTLDADGRVTNIGAESNYHPVYGTIRTLSGSTVLLEMDDGTFRSYAIPAGTPVYRNGSASALSKATTGDGVKLLVQENAGTLSIAEVSLSTQSAEIDDIYRATFESFDPIRNAISVSGVKHFLNGSWVPGDDAAVKSVLLSDDYAPDLDGNTEGTVFFAVREDAAGRERVVRLAVRDPLRYESAVADSILQTASGGAQLWLTGTSSRIDVDDDAIVIRDGRLADAGSLRQEDTAEVSAGNTSASGVLQADVIVAESGNDSLGLAVYRGRITEVQALSTVTLESFARLNGVAWDFSNTPKTFDLSQTDTRLLLEDGVGNMRAFTDDAYAKKTMYFLVDGSRALVVSDGVYGDTALSGTVTALTGGSLDDDGSWLTQPTALTISGARVYNPETYLWESDDTTNVTLLPNTLIPGKNGQMKASEIKAGDHVTVIRTDGSEDALILTVD